MLNRLKNKFYTPPPSLPTDRPMTNDLPSPPKPIDKQQISHYVLCTLSILLILFTLTSSIVLLVISTTNSDISEDKGLTAFMMFMAVLITLVSSIAIYMSWKKIKQYLQIYQYGCFVTLVLLIMILIGIALSNADNYSNSSPIGSVLGDCNSPKTFFQYSMLDVSTNGSNMFCSSSCPCPQYTQVQQCPGWQPSPYDTITQYMESKFSCSGWCIQNYNVNYIFSAEKPNGPSTGPCYYKWKDWVHSQWKSVKGCISTIVFLLFFNLLGVNWRILLITKQN